jgi:hypothetical protein
MKKPRNSLLFDKLGVSYTISAVIMTVTAITLTLVASSYAYQILEQQRGATEFDVAMESILAFNDALENIAWKLQASRSARFTVDYGQLELIPDINLIVNVTDYPGASYSSSTGHIVYCTKTRYVNFGEHYQSYFLGDNGTLSTGAGSYGRGSIEQKSGWVYMTLSYGVRAMKASTIETTNGTVRVNNVDIWIMRMNITKPSTNIGEFDLKAKCLDLTTETHAPEGNGYDVLSGQCNITVQLGDNPLDTATIELDGDKVVFNFVIATVQVKL